MTEAIKAWILFKLLRHRYWGEKHTSFDNLPKGKPSHLAKQIRNVGKELIKDDLLLSKPAHYGQEISLNPKKKEEIEKIISKYYKI
ncbi:hypothetical protein A3K63_04480 [Candidatus Micrarchaeota archaeon RBG_16_49_10]|nr:MAG: hypothetical protein A3K63_04480 [Candidatus Micrarchaeota archaeon RBG_16_49_10]